MAGGLADDDSAFQVFEELEREQILGDAVAALTPRCREMIRCFTRLPRYHTRKWPGGSP